MSNGYELVLTVMSRYFAATELGSLWRLLRDEEKEAWVRLSEDAVRAQQVVWGSFGGYAWLFDR